MASALLADLQLATPQDRTWGWTPLLVSRGLRVVPLARARSAVQFDQGNVLVGHTFTVARTHADYAAAGLYLDRLPVLVGRAFGTFVADRGLGGPLITYLGAAVTGLQAQPHQGIRTVVTFTVVGTPAD